MNCHAGFATARARPHIANMKNPKNDLAAIIDRLGPNLWLHVDDVYLRAVFGSDGTVEAARQFAEGRGGCFLSLLVRQSSFGSVGAFGRAYFKADEA